MRLPIRRDPTLNVRKTARILGVVALSACAQSTAEESAPLSIEARIPLGELKGRIDHLAIDLAANRLVQPGDIDGDDGPIGAFGQSIDEAVADLAAGAGDDDDSFADQIYTLAIDQMMASAVSSRHTAAPMK